LRKIRTAVVAATLSALLWSAGSDARACDAPEKLRLGEEQRKLAARNAWSGVERAYANLQATGCVLDFDHHFLGAESARYLGKTWEQHERLSQARGLDPQPEIIEGLQAVEAAYGRVDVRGDPRRRPVLVRSEMPFAPDQRKSIEYAQQVVAQTGSFYGMLPAGDYVAGAVAFTVDAGQDVAMIEVGKTRSSGAADRSVSSAAGGTVDQALVRYAGLVFTVGPGFLLTPMGERVPSLQDGVPQFSPAEVAAPGLSAQLGGELGLTYAEPALGLAAVVGYSGGFGGSDTLHAINGWLAGVARPGSVRLALGPMYQVTVGSGTGVHPDFDIGHDQGVDPNDALPYRGLGWGGGVQGAAGLGLLDLSPLQGVVELGGSWQHDGARSYYSVGLRFGVVPAVPRFEG